LYCCCGLTIACITFVTDVKSTIVVDIVVVAVVAVAIATHVFDIA
jgi:hypothetical protein